ncbi:MAG: DUF1580 domain-containing protein [Planctomycetes bacterium]|nr:DUF1580 domain-containing protein [Planctomycetota bacterium]
MIRIETEKLISLSDACELLPRRRRGRKPCFSTLWRWAMEGISGVRMETLRVGGTLCTSHEALQRFFQRLSELGEQQSASGTEGRTSGGGNDDAND